MTTPREQLTHIITNHQLGQPKGGTANGSAIECSCGLIALTAGDRDHATYLGHKHIADKIIAAGWTAPPPSTINPHAEN